MAGVELLLPQGGMEFVAPLLGEGHQRRLAPMKRRGKFACASTEARVRAPPRDLTQPDSVLNMYCNCTKM